MAVAEQPLDALDVGDCAEPVETLSEPLSSRVAAVVSPLKRAVP